MFLCQGLKTLSLRSLQSLFAIPAMESITQMVGLRELSLRGAFCRKAEIVVNTLSHLQSLEKVHLDIISEIVLVTLRVLSSLGKVKDVTFFTFGPVDPTPPSPPDPTPINFPALQSLHLIHTRTALANALISACFCCNMR